MHRKIAEAEARFGGIWGLIGGGLRVSSPDSIDGAQVGTSGCAV